MGNACCRIFKEQIDLINQLPKRERAIVLYAVINNCFSQFDNQNENQFDNQNENQNECAYVSVSVYTLDSLSVLGKSVYNLLCKNITVKEFSNNYGGKRENAGAKKKNATGNNQVEIQVEKTHPAHTARNKFIPPTIDEVMAYAKQQNDMAGVGGFACTEQIAQDFYDYYAGIGWMLPNDSRTPIVDWRPFLSKWARDSHRFQKTTQPRSRKRDINDPNNFII